MPTVYTIGFQKKSLEEFIRLLREHKCDAVIDVRLRNTSQLAGYSKRDDLAFLLEQGFGIAYEHHPDLAPTDEVLDRYRSSHDFTGYEAALTPLLVERHAERVGQEVLAKYKAPCLLCAEPKADTCHRRLVAEYWAKHIPDITIVHL